MKISLIDTLRKRTAPRDNFPRISMSHLISYTTKPASHQKSGHRVPESLGHLLEVYQTILDTLPYIVLVTDEYGDITYANRHFKIRTEKIGLKVKNVLVKNTWENLIHPKDYALYRKNLEASFSEKKTTETELRIKIFETGEFSWFLARVQPVPMPGTPDVIQFVCTLNSIHMEKTALEQAIESEERLKRLFGSNLMAITISDLHERIFEVNEVFADMLGYTREDFTSGRVGWSDITPPEYHLIDKRKVKTILKGGMIKPFEKEYIAKNGKRIPVLVGAVLLKHNPRSNKNTRAFCFAIDISKQKTLERRKDYFISIAGHELRTPLSTIKLYADFLYKEFGSRPDLKEEREWVRNIGVQTDTLTKLIHDLFNLSKIQSGKLEYQKGTLDMELLVERVVERMKLNHTNTEILCVKPKRPHGNFGVLGDRERLEEVFINLISNAIKYSQGKARVIVSIEKRSRNLKVGVQDFGIGIAKKEQAKIFTPFYQIKDKNTETKSGGLGIGLYLARKIIRDHRGTISVKSIKGKGSTFFVTLPLKKRSNNLK